MKKFLFKYNFSNHLLTNLLTEDKNIKIENTNFSILFWGDPINYTIVKELDLINPEQIVKNIIGNYYYLLIIKNNNNVYFGNSAFGILPLYYSKIINNEIYISNDVIQISEHLKEKTINKRFILENILFNYQLFNQSTYKEINLLPCNHCLELNNKLKLTCIFKIEDLFTKTPTKWRKAADSISSLFLERVKEYFPNEKFAVSLTGGFDGRTLVASALFYKLNFDIYSFGKQTSTDVSIPKKIASQLKITHHHVSLDLNYINNESFSNGIEFITNNNGCASFSRAHYLYATKQLSDKFNYLITGNFGSELFRAAHIAGVMISNNLYKLFNAESYEQAILEIEKSDEWNGLNKDQFKEEWHELKEDLKQLPCFDKYYKSYTKNQQFYIVVFNEVFRKYFGPELINQYKYLINRTPFLDIQFITELLKTELSGIYSDYFSHNPFKRFKGQIAYAHIIQKAYPSLGKIKTDKGYAPADLLSMQGKLTILINYIKKHLSNKKSHNADGYSVNASFNYNKNQFKSLINNKTKYINYSLLDKGLNGDFKDRDAFFILLSQNIWISKQIDNETKKI